MNTSVGAFLNVVMFAGACALGYLVAAGIGMLVTVIREHRKPKFDPERDYCDETKHANVD